MFVYNSKVCFYIQGGLLVCLFVCSFLLLYALGSFHRLKCVVFKVILLLQETLELMEWIMLYFMERIFLHCFRRCLHMERVVLCCIFSV